MKLVFFTTYFNRESRNNLGYTMKYSCALMNSRYTCHNHPVIDSTFPMRNLLITNKSNSKMFFHEGLFHNFKLKTNLH